MPIAHCLASRSSLFPYRGSICTPRQTKWSARWTSANMHWKLWRRGYLTIRETVFETSSHCALVNEDREKYWNSVKVLAVGGSANPQLRGFIPGRSLLLNSC